MAKRIVLWTPLLFLACSLAYLLPAYAYEAWWAAHPVTSPQLIVDLSAASSTPQSLAYYVQAERLDPIFAIEGTDPAKLRAALRSLFDERDQIAKLYTKKEGQTIVASLYPHEFLILLPDLEAARQAMLQEPTVANAKKYHRLLIEATSAYAVGARAVAATIESLSPIFVNIGYLGGTATTSDLAPKLTKVSSLALLQKKKELARYDCFEHFSAHCPSLLSLQEKQDGLLAATLEVLPNPPSSVYKADALSRQMLPSLPQFMYASKTIYAISSDCFRERVAYLREYYGEQVPGEVARKQSVLNDVYFYDLPKLMDAEKNVPLFTQLAKAGVMLEYQNVGNQYMCPNSGFDVSSIGSIVGVANAIAKKQNQTPQEKILLSLPLLQKSDIAPYVRAKAKEHTKEGGALAEMYIEGSEGFDMAIMGAYSDNHFLITWDKTQHPVRYEYMLTVRNFASLLFLMGNPTFMPEKISLFSNTEPSPLGRLFLREYLNDVSKQYTDAEIMTQFRRSVEITIDAKLRSR